VSDPLPNYIPPHLRGLVGAFRKEDDGDISFDDAYNPNGLIGEAGRTRISEQKYKDTFDWKSRFATPDPNGSMGADKDYRIRRKKGIKEMLGEGIGGYSRKLYDWGTSDAGKSVGTAGAVYGLGGAGLGYLLSNYLGTSGVSTSLLGALLAGTMGAGATAYGQSKSNKGTQEKKASLDLAPELIDLIKSSSLGTMGQAHVLQALSTIPGEEVNQILNTAPSGGSKDLMRSIVGGILQQVTSPPKI